MIERTPVHLTAAEMDALGTFIAAVKAYEPRLISQFPLRPALDKAIERITRVALGFPEE